VTIGNVSIKHPANPNDDIARLKEKGVEAMSSRTIFDERGISTSRCSPSQNHSPLRVAEIFDQHDQIWHW